MLQIGKIVLVIHARLVLQPDMSHHMNLRTRSRCELGYEIYRVMDMHHICIFLKPCSASGANLPFDTTICYSRLSPDMPLYLICISAFIMRQEECLAASQL